MEEKYKKELATKDEAIRTLEEQLKESHCLTATLCQQLDDRQVTEPKQKFV